MACRTGVNGWQCIALPRLNDVLNYFSWHRTIMQTNFAEIYVNVVMSKVYYYSGVVEIQGKLYKWMHNCSV